MELLTKSLQEIVDECGADIVKVYFLDSNHYRVKVIKDGVIIKKIGKGIMPPVDLKGNGEGYKKVSALLNENLNNPSTKNYKRCSKRK